MRLPRRGTNLSQPLPKPGDGFATNPIFSLDALPGMINIRRPGVYSERERENTGREKNNLRTKQRVEQHRDLLQRARGGGILSV